MARIVEYDQVIATLAQQGLQPAYPNGGSFHVVDGTVVGYITTNDASIRPGLDVRQATDLPGILIGLRQSIGGRLWLTPAHHWAHELHHGGNGRALLDAVGLAFDTIETSAAAVEFAADEDVRLVLDVLFTESDWHATFPDATVPTTAMLHHHRQLWVTTKDAQLLPSLR